MVCRYATIIGFSNEFRRRAMCPMVCLAIYRGGLSFRLANVTSQKSVSVSQNWSSDSRTKPTTFRCIGWGGAADASMIVPFFLEFWP